VRQRPERFSKRATCTHDFGEAKTPHFSTSGGADKLRDAYWPHNTRPVVHHGAAAVEAGVRGVTTSIKTGHELPTSRHTKGILDLLPKARDAACRPVQHLANRGYAQEDHSSS